MESFQKKIENLIQQSIREARVELETLSNGHVCGHVISPEFDGVSHKDRRLRVREVLEEGLARDEMLNVSTLLTYTPAEWSWDLQQS